MRLLAGAALLLLLAGALRAGFTAAQGLPNADPWRHLLLLENLRAGRGFTLFDGQPYIWYSPVWYWLAASAAAPESARWIAAACSALAVPLFALWVWRLSDGDAIAAGAAGLLLAGFGPLIAASCQLGAEGFALLLLAASLALATGRHAALAGLAGALFGLAVAARLQLALAAFLFLPLWRRPRAAAGFAAAAALPLALHWWRNWRVIHAYPFVFTWDGLATASADYGPVSTLAVQLHPSVVAATRLLYEQTHARPEWLFLDGRLRLEMLLALALLVAAVAASRRLGLALAAAAGLVTFVGLDTTLSARFFRIWLGLFPVLFAGAALVAARLARGGRAGRLAAAALVGVPLAAGLPDLRAQPIAPLEAVTPPPELVTAPQLFVNSGNYHPESLIYRYREHRFLGMPFEPAHWAEFAALYPETRSILWHGYNVQRELFLALRDSGDWEVARRATNPAGYAYRLWEAR